MVRAFAWALVSISCCLLAACNQSPPPSAVIPVHDHGHDHHGHDHGTHEAGPNGGHIIEIGDHAYHVEWTHDDDSGEVAVFLLDSEMEEPVEIDAATLTISVQIGEETRSHELTAVRADGAESGAASQFTITDKPLIEALKLAGQGVEATLDVPIGDETYTVSFEHEAH